MLFLCKQLIDASFIRLRKKDTRNSPGVDLVSCDVTLIKVWKYKMLYFFTPSKYTVR